MIQTMKRRELIAGLGALLGAPLLARFFTPDAMAAPGDVGNFRYIYSNPELKREFLDFLTNVFHLYPEQELHETVPRRLSLRYPRTENAEEDHGGPDPDAGRPGCHL